MRDSMFGSQDLRECFKEPVLHDGILMATHDAVNMETKSQAAWPMVRVMARQPDLPTTRPAGPVRPRVHWAGVTDTIRQAKEELQGQRTQEWQSKVDMARHELGVAMAADLEEACGCDMGTLHGWTQVPDIEEKRLDQVLARRCRLLRRPLTIMLALPACCWG